MRSPIGAVRPDGTEKPEAEVLAGYAAFADKSPQSFTRIEPPAVTMVTSQALLYSNLGGTGAGYAEARAARHGVLRSHAATHVAGESAGRTGKPKLVFLPSAQGLTDKAWSELLDYVARGGTLLVTGPVDRDEHWQPVDRAADSGSGGNVIRWRCGVRVDVAGWEYVSARIPRRRAAGGDMDDALRRWEVR